MTIFSYLDIYFGFFLKSNIIFDNLNVSDKQNNLSQYYYLIDIKKKLKIKIQNIKKRNSIKRQQNMAEI